VHPHGCIRPIADADPRVTSIDVARRAGVSQSTVSLVLSGKGRGRISARTEEAVRRAAEELGYRPNVAARALRTGAARSIGLVVPDVTNPVFGRVLRGAQASARDAGYTVMLVDVANDFSWQVASIEALRAAAVDGFLSFRVAAPEQAGAPVVVLEGAPAGVPSVIVDAERGTDLALGHLRERGHERLGHVASAIEAPTFAIRAERFRAHGGDERLEVAAAFTFDDAARAALELLDRPKPPTAIFCDDDLLAGGVYLAARERGVRIPEDLSVCGFDDLDFARVLSPPLTTIAFDAEALGATAARRLLTAIAGEPGPDREVVPVELVVRGSTAQQYG
jgi:DNA-binding LacI/PurR family transcriptional regulator